MNDTGLVSRFERLGHLFRDGERFLDRDATSSDALSECRTFDKLQNERLHADRVFETVDARDVRMVQRREKLCLTLEAGQALFVLRELFRQDFDRDVAVEFRVASAVDLALSRLSQWAR